MRAVRPLSALTLLPDEVRLLRSPLVTLSTHTRITLAAVVCAAVAMVWPTAASAQHRSRGGGRVSTFVVSPVYYGYGFYDPFWWGGGGFYPYGWYDPLYPPGTYESNDASARLQVKPSKAEVYVDGRYAGRVSDFDGVLQRLDVPAGEHELTFYLEGYRTLTERVRFRSGKALDIKYELQRLPAGETAAPPPEPAPEPNAYAAPPQAPRPRTEPRPSSNFGTLAIRVQPADAALLVDGEEWSASEGAGPVRIEVSDGSHEIEVRKEGFSTFHRTVRVRAGETVSLNVSLSR
jgi:hypothetical protein